MTLHETVMLVLEECPTLVFMPCSGPRISQLIHNDPFMSKCRS